MNIYQIANQMKINHQTIYDINIRVAYYVRVSTLREQQDSSVDNQIIHFEKLIKFYETVDNSDLKQWIYDTCIDGIKLN